MSGVLASFQGALAYFAGWCLTSCFVAYLDVYVCRRGDASQLPDPAPEFLLRTVGGCAFLPIPGIGFAVGAVVGSFWSWGWHLAPWWGSPIGAVHLLLLSAVTRWLPDLETRGGMWLWFCLWLAYLLAVPGVTGLLVASETR
jgi:hypothetical protein